MPIDLPSYSKIKNRYCISYFGPKDEYVKQLRWARPYILKKYPELEIYIACKESAMHLLEGEAKVLDQKTLQSKRRSFAHIRQLKYDMSNKTNPVKKLLDESDIPYPKEIFKS